MADIEMDNLTRCCTIFDEGGSTRHIPSPALLLQMVSAGTVLRCRVHISITHAVDQADKRVIYAYVSKPTVA